MSEKLNLKEDAIYRVKNGQLEKVVSPQSGFGKQVITWQNGRITNCEVSFTVK